MAVQHGKFDIRSTLIYLTGNKTKGKFMDEQQRKYKINAKGSTRLNAKEVQVPPRKKTAHVPACLLGQKARLGR
jgi:hypothetical protein